MTRAAKIGSVVIGLVAFVLAAALFVVGTDSGTRWALGRAAGYLPQQLVLGESQGSFLRGVRFRSVEWSSEAARVSITNLYANVEFLPLLSRHIAFNELLVDRADIRVFDTGEGETSGDLPTIDLPVNLSIASSSLKSVSYGSQQFARTVDELSVIGRWHGTDLEVERLQVDSAWLQLSLNGQVQLSDHYRSRIHAEWQWTESTTVPFAGVLQIEGDLRGYELQHSLNAPVSVNTSGGISYEADSLIADLLHEWESLEWPIGERQLHSPAGSLRMQGDIADIAVTLNASAQLDDLPETSILLVGIADLESIRDSQLTAVNELGRLMTKGDFRWLPEPVFDLSFSLADVDLSTVSPAVAGTLRGDGDVSYRGSALSLDDIRLQLGTNRVDASGSIGETVSLNAAFDIEALAELLPGAAGKVHGSVAVSGARESPDAMLQLKGSALAWKDYALDFFSVSASGQIDRHNVRAVIQAHENELMVGATGGYSQDQWSGKIEKLSIGNEVLGRWSNREPGALAASRDSVSLSRTCLFGPSQPGRACLGGTYRTDGVTELDLSMTELPLATLPATLPANINLSGFIDAQFRGEFSDQRLTGEAGIELRQARIDTTIDGEAIDVVFSDATGEATFTANRVNSIVEVATADGAGSGRLELEIQDVTDRQSPITGQGTIAIRDASLFGILVPGISNPVGQIDGATTISGSLGEPEFLGQVTLTDGSFGVRQAGIQVSEVDLRITQRAAGQLQLSGSARSGSGEISIQGDTRVGIDSGVRTELLLAGENFELARLPDWTIAASPSITVVLDERRTSVKGELELPKANISLREIPETAMSPSKDAVVHRPEGTESATGRRIDIDVKTSLGSNVQFSGFGLTTGLEGAVRLRGGTHTPYVGTGRLTLREGRYKAYGQQLEIERGELIFNGPLDNPQLNVRAVRRTQDVVAGIQLSGTPSQLSSELFSEPPLGDPEALSYLLTGRPLASATSAGEGDALNNAAFALGMSGAGSITSQIRTELGLETLTVEGGAEDGRIIAGKRIGDRLLVEYGYGLIDKLGTLLLRYQLSDRLVLESRTGTISNLDILYSVKKK